MAERFLYEKLDVAKEVGMSVDFPEIIKSGLSKRISLREYQIDAFTNFALYFDNAGLRKISKSILCFIWRQAAVKLSLWQV